MGSGGGGSSQSNNYMQQQQLAIQREQMAVSQKQHEESMAMQRDAMNRPVASIQKNVSLATQNMVQDQAAERNNLRGIRSTYSMFAKRQEDDETASGGATKLGA